MTPDSVHRRWVMLEIGAAWCLGARMRVTLLLCHMPTDPLPDTMKFKKAVSINDFDIFTEELTARVRKYHGDG